MDSRPATLDPPFILISSAAHTHPCASATKAAPLFVQLHIPEKVIQAKTYPYCNPYQFIHPPYYKGKAHVKQGRIAQTVQIWALKCTSRKSELGQGHTPWLGFLKSILLPKVGIKWNKACTLPGIWSETMLKISIFCILIWTPDFLSSLVTGERS